MSALGELVLTQRKRSGISQRSLAIRAGTSQSAISRIETGRENPSWERFTRIMTGLGWRPELTFAPIAAHDMTLGEARRQATLTPQQRLDEALARWKRRGAGDQFLSD